LNIALRLNGADLELSSRADETLLTALRRRGLRSVRLTCGIGVCGACTVLVDGLAMSSCLLLAPMVAGREVLTVEGLPEDDRLVHAFQSASAYQCGYCTPGMVLTARALLCEDPQPDEEKIRHAMAGNLCRCGSYVKILDAIKSAVGG
jgi:aerobic-type carbon monoxide dehydrogenase small subunit (CoxS/CutS family)